MSRLIVISAVSLSLWTSVVQAAPSVISDIVIANYNNELLVSASYKGEFTQEIKKEIIKGVSKEFFYYILLTKVMSNWLDEEKASKTIKFTLKYDILKNQFLVTKSKGELQEDLVFESYEEMVAWISKIDNISIASLKLLNKKDRYYISIKAEMKAGELPFLLRYLLFFVPYSKFSTEWVHSKVFMLKDLR